MTESELRGAVVAASCDAALGGYRVEALNVDEWSVWLALSTTRHDGRGTEGALYLFAPDRLGDPRAVPFAAGLLAALRAVIERATAESARKWAVGWLDVRMPIDVLDVDATADDFREQFLTWPWLGRLLPNRPTKPPPFVRAPARAVMRDGALDLPALFAWVNAHAQRTYDDRRWDEAMIGALPAPVRVLQGLWLVESSVGGNGFEVFLLQASGAEVRHVHASLEAAGAKKLARLMGAGIDLAAQHGAEFMRERSKKWLDAFEGLAADDWSEIDGHEPNRSFALIESELRPCALRWAERHRDAVVR